MKKLMVLLCTAVTLFAGSGKKTIFGWASPWQSFPLEEEISALTHLVIYPIYPKTAKGDFYCEFSAQKIDSLVNMARRQNVKVLVSFGAGNVRIGTHIENDPTYQSRMATYLCDFVAKHKLDGVDNAWEVVWLKDEKEKHNELLAMRKWFNPLSKTVRDSLDVRFGRGAKIFTTTVSCKNEVWFGDSTLQADNSVYQPGFWDVPDYVMLMNYNDALGENHSSLAGTKEQVAHWIDQGMTKEKIVIGIPYFGQATWENQKIGSKIVPSIKLYKEIVKENPNLTPDQNSVTYSFVNDSGETKEVTYGFNGVDLVKEKITYADTSAFSGILFWQLGMDIPMSHPLSLTRAIKETKGTSGIAKSEVGVRSMPVSSVGNTLILNTEFAKNPFTMTLFNTQGRLIKVENFESGTSQIQLTDLPKGMWFIRVTSSSTEIVIPHISK